MHAVDDKHSIKMLDVFRIPIFSVKFDQHDLYKESWSKFISEFDYQGRRRKKHFCITTPNLHKNELFNPLRVFFLHSLYQCLAKIGIDHDVGITSMWGTQQTHGGYHHMHSHGNSYFAGVYYLKSEGAKEPSGTVFQNVMSDFHGMVRMNRNMINAKKDFISSSFSHSYHEPFEEGKLVIFPAWLRHTTETNDNEKRQVLAFNTMPIGMTNTDQHDRYIWQDFRNLSMFGDQFDSGQIDH